MPFIYFPTLILQSCVYGNLHVEKKLISEIHLQQQLFPTAVSDTTLASCLRTTLQEKSLLLTQLCCKKGHYPAVAHYPVVAQVTMTYHHCYVVVLCLVMSTAAIPYQKCGVCMCERYSMGVTAQCIGLHITSVPQDLPANVTRL